MAHFNGRIPPQQHHYGFDAQPSPHQQHAAPAPGRDYGPNALMRGLMRGVNSFINYRTKVSLANLDYCSTLQGANPNQARFEGFSSHLHEPPPQHPVHGAPAHAAQAPQMGATLGPDTAAFLEQKIAGLQAQFQQFSQQMEALLRDATGHGGGQTQEARPTRDRVNDLHRQQARRDRPPAAAPAPQGEDSTAHALDLLNSQSTRRPHVDDSDTSSITSDEDYRQDQDRDDGRDTGGRSRPIIDERQVPSGSTAPGMAAGGGEAANNSYGADGAQDLTSAVKAHTNLNRDGRDQAVHLTR